MYCSAPRTVPAQIRLHLQTLHKRNAKHLRYVILQEIVTHDSGSDTTSYAFAGNMQRFASKTNKDGTSIRSDKQLIKKLINTLQVSAHRCTPRSRHERLCTWVFC